MVKEILLYDVSRIVLKPGFEATTGQLVIAFDYFEHSQGDFCTIDSYLHEAGIGEDEIPTFDSSVLGITELKNVIDFRPKVDSTAIIPGFLDTSTLRKNRRIICWMLEQLFLVVLLLISI